MSSQMGFSAAATHAWSQVGNREDAIKWHQTYTPWFTTDQINSIMTNYDQEIQSANEKVKDLKTKLIDVRSKLQVIKEQIHPTQPVRKESIDLSSTIEHNQQIETPQKIDESLIKEMEQLEIDFKSLQDKLYITTAQNASSFHEIWRKNCS